MIQLSDKFNYRKLLRFTFPSIIMMVFTSIYGVVDGYFVSNYVGKTPFTAINFIMPVIMILGAVGFMFGTGGSALIAKTMGEGDINRANRIFSFLIYVSLATGVLVSALGIIFIRPVAAALGATGQMLEDCVLYSRIILAANPAFILQYAFQCLFVTAEKPSLGLYVTVAAGVTNMVLDALLVAVFPLGLVGAALATGISQIVGGVLPIFYFARKNGSKLRLGKPEVNMGVLGRICLNGSSELMSNISMSVVGMFFNAQLLHYAGEDGVAAYGVLMYVSFIFISIFVGYSVGVAPVIGYNYGARKHAELKGLLKKSLVIVGCASIAMFACGFALSAPFSKLFVGYDEGLLALTVRAFAIFSFSFLFSGFCIFGSSFFTALNNGLVSAAISFLRTLVFQIAAVMLLPLIFDVDGIWASIVVAEALAAVVAFVFVAANKKKYNY